MIFLVRIRVLPKLLQTCRVFLSFFCQGQKIHQVRYVCPKKTVYLLKEYWLGELNRPSFCRCSKFHGVFGWKKLKNYETKKTQNAKEQLCKASASWGFFSTKTHRVNGRFFCTKGQSGNPMIWNMLQKHVHVYVTSTWTSVSQLSQLEKSQSLIQWCSDVQNLKKKLSQPSNPKPSAELCHPRHEWRVDSQGLQEVKCHNGFGWAKKPPVEYWHNWLTTEHVERVKMFRNPLVWWIFLVEYNPATSTTETLKTGTPKWPPHLLRG